MRLFTQFSMSLWDKIIEWLTRDTANHELPMSDFDRLRYEIRPGDVILVEGRSHVSNIIKTITLSNWTHSALYIGRLHDIENHQLREFIQKFYDGETDDQLIIESVLGKGTIIDNVKKYREDHLRICRPTALTHKDSQQVISYSLHQLGTYYNVRQILDLARFFFPYGILPRRWRSSLFEHNAGAPTHTVCSSMMAEAFASVHFPILPVVHHDKNGNLRMYKRNTKLITPKDFDYSPYFDVIKYPVLDFDELTIYRKMPWGKDGVIFNDADDAENDEALNKLDEQSDNNKTDDISDKTSTEKKSDQRIQAANNRSV